MLKAVDLTGKRFGKLFVIEIMRLEGKGEIFWKCVCDCGKETIVSGSNLKNGNTKSCGCIHSELLIKRNTSHGFSQNESLYSVWRGIKSRCYCVNGVYYKNYGGRGIVVCDDWKNDYVMFRNWALENGYVKGLSIDRIDNNGNYEPSNCKFSTRVEQANNTSKNRFILWEGKTQTIKQWSEEIGMKYTSLSQRINKCGWSIEKSFTTPIKHKA